MSTVVPADMKLSDVLRMFGWTYREPSDKRLTDTTMSREIVDQDGAVLFTGPAWDAWKWLRNEHGVTTSALCEYCALTHDLLDDCPGPRVAPPGPLSSSPSSVPREQNSQSSNDGSK
jgi:hypothetical protein